MNLARATIVSVLLASIASAADYMPLKEGNQWTYTMSNGMQIVTKITGFESVRGVRCAVVESTVGGQTSREYMAVDTQGLKSYMSQMQGQQFPYDPPVLRVKLPYRPGDTWQATISQTGMSMNTTFESAGQEQIQTPAGSFDCVKVVSSMEAGGQSMGATIWYADGIGPVHQIMKMGGQEIEITLVSTNVKPVPAVAQRTVTPPTNSTPASTAQSVTELRCPKCGAKIPAGAKFCSECGTKIEPPKPTIPTNCPKCGAKLPPGAKFCPACGEKIAATVPAPQPVALVQPEPTPQPAPTNGPAMERYQSDDGKVLLYKPADWRVTEGYMFGKDVYSVVVMEPHESAVALFMTFPVDQEIKDSVVLAAKCIAALRREFPDLQATNMNSTPDRERTIAELTLTDDGEKGTGHGYFFYTQSIGTFYLLLAKTEVWEEFRPTLTAIMANFAFAPEGVTAVQNQAERTAETTPVVEGAAISPAAVIKQASQRPGKQLPLQQATLPDQSMSLQIPQGWALEGQRIQYTLTDNAQTRARGMGSMMLTIIPTDIQTPGVINAPYQTPPEALSLVLESGKTTRNVQIISQCKTEQVVPEAAQTIQQLQAQGFQVDARLLHIRCQNVPTGATLRGMFSVMCLIKSMSPVWQVCLQGSWAPENEFDDWLPLYMRIEKTAQVNQQWMGQDMQNQVTVQQQLNRNLQRSIAESNQAFDGYLDSLQNADRSRDYISHMWSETTLGQGSWVAENEGTRVYQTDSWGIEGPEGRVNGQAYNTTNFTGQNPWSGRDMEMIDTRAEYERYIANQ